MKDIIYEFLDYISLERKYSNNTEFKSDISLKDLQNPQYIANEYWKQKHDNNDMPKKLMEMFLKVSNEVINNKI